MGINSETVEQTLKKLLALSDEELWSKFEAFLVECLSVMPSKRKKN